MFLLSSWNCLCPIYWCHVLSWKWRCSWSCAVRRCSNYIWVINNSIAYRGASYIKDFTVTICNTMRLIRVINFPIWNWMWMSNNDDDRQSKINICHQAKSNPQSFPYNCVILCASNMLYFLEKNIHLLIGPKQYIAMMIVWLQNVSEVEPTSKIMIADYYGTYNNKTGVI